MDKSYVTLETNVCPVCGKEHETGRLLLDTHLENRFEHTTCTGYSMCEEHQKQLDDGYVFLVEVSGTEPRDNPPRTGKIAAIRKQLADDIFTAQEIKTITYVEEGVMEMLENMVAKNSDADTQGVAQNIDDNTQEVSQNV